MSDLSSADWALHTFLVTVTPDDMSVWERQLFAFWSGQAPTYPKPARLAPVVAANPRRRPLAPQYQFTKQQLEAANAAMGRKTA